MLGQGVIAYWAVRSIICFFHVVGESSGRGSEPEVPVSLVSKLVDAVASTNKAERILALFLPSEGRLRLQSKPSQPLARYQFAPLKLLL